MFLVSSLFAATALAKGFNSLVHLDLSELGDGLTGEYKGEKTILGQKISGDLTFSADTVSFVIGGSVDIDCPSEKYTVDANGAITLTDISDPTDCAAQALSKHNAKLDSAVYDAAADTVTINLDVILKIALVLHKVSAELPAPLAIVGGAPAGEYYGTKSVLGITVNADMKFSSADLEFTITGEVSLDCSNEPYTYSNGVISLTNLGNSDDCVTNDLSKEDVSLESITYSESSDVVTIKVKHGLVKITMDLTTKQVDRPLNLPLFRAVSKLEDRPVRVGANPAGEYSGSKTVLGVTVNADMKYSDSTLEFGITGAVSLDCSGEPYTYANGVVSLTNIGNADDCVKKDLDKEDVTLQSITYDESSDVVKIKVKHGFVKIELDMNKVN